MTGTSWRRMALVASAVILIGGCSASTSTSGSEASSPPPTPAPTASAQPSASAAASVAPSPSLVPATSPSPNPVDAVPATPTGTSFTLIKESVASDGITTLLQYRAKWSEAAGAVTKFLVYGVGDCLRSSQENDNLPCVVAGTELPASELKLIGTAGGTARTLDVSWTLNDEEGPGPYQAVVLFAENGNGRSAPAVLWSAIVCYGCVL